VLFEDETDVLWFPPLGGAWARRGQSLPVVLGGRNARRVLFGTIHLHSGHRLLLSQERQRAVDFQAFLDLIAWHYRGWHPVLLLDGDPSHTAAASQALAQELNIELLWLPKRAPELNGMDHLWRHGKAVVSVNRQYQTVGEHVDRLSRHLLSLSPQQALLQAGTRSDGFWLQGF